MTPYLLFRIIFFLLGLLGFCLGTVADDLVSPKTSNLAPGYGQLPFALPKPGSYALPFLGQAADGDVLDTNGKPLKLHELFDDKVVVLSFIYSTCDDVNGCPLATAVLHKIKSRLSKEPELASSVRLLTLSFNPENDTPETMAHYGEYFQGQGIDWHFLTTLSETELEPILSAYRHSVQKIYDEQGRNTGTFSHLLRVYLIDPNRQIRNIYNVAFLHADTLINDIRTLLLETAPTKTDLVKDTTAQSYLYGAGDNKDRYSDPDYRTRSAALQARTGKALNLLENALKPPLGLPKLLLPKTNPLTREKINLGRQLFYDRRLSLNKTFSCAMCHIPEQGFTSNEMATAVGVEGRTVRRNSPTVYNVGYLHTLFHDGRETTLEQQVWAPLLAHNEMANPSIGYVIETVDHIPEYRQQFQKIFGKNPNMETIGMAIASYERTLNSANSDFDRWYYGKVKDAMSANAQAGFRLFTGKAGCSQCHTIESSYALFTDQAFHNTGVGFTAAMSRSESKKQVQLAPGVFVEVDAEVIKAVSEPKSNDLGRYEVTQEPRDRWRYKTPTLRNIELTAPYMHDGSMPTLKSVIEFYNRGGVANENLDPVIKPLNLTEEEIDSLTEFMRALTGDNIALLVSDAFAAPVGDVE